LALLAPASIVGQYIDIMAVRVSELWQLELTGWLLELLAAVSTTFALAAAQGLCSARVTLESCFSRLVANV
jgi:hypothetical protein